MITKKITWIWEMLLRLRALGGEPALAADLGPCASHNIDVSLARATEILANGQWVYLTAHHKWGRSMTLTYIGVGLGAIDFVDVMLRRMGRSFTFGDTRPFQFADAVAWARERGQDEMARYLCEYMAALSSYFPVAVVSPTGATRNNP